MHGEKDKYLPPVNEGGKLKFNGYEKHGVYPDAPYELDSSKDHKRSHSDALSSDMQPSGTVPSTTRLNPWCLQQSTSQKGSYGATSATGSIGATGATGSIGATGTTRLSGATCNSDMQPSGIAPNLRKLTETDYFIHVDPFKHPSCCPQEGFQGGYYCMDPGRYQPSATIPNHPDSLHTTNKRNHQDTVPDTLTTTQLKKQKT